MKHFIINRLPICTTIGILIFTVHACTNDDPGCFNTFQDPPLEEEHVNIEYVKTIINNNIITKEEE